MKNEKNTQKGKTVNEYSLVTASLNVVDNLVMVQRTNEKKLNELFKKFQERQGPWSQSEHDQFAFLLGATQTATLILEKFYSELKV